MVAHQGINFLEAALNLFFKAYYSLFEAFDSFLESAYSLDCHGNDLVCFMP